MKLSGKHLLVAGIAGAVLLGGGAGAALAADGTARPDPAGKADINDHRAAAAIAQKAVPGRVTSTELDREDGYTVWEVKITDRTGVHHEVTIDAASGKIIENETHRHGDHDDHDDHGDHDDHDDD